MQTKICIKCNTEKEAIVLNFSIRSDTKELNNICKICVSEYQQKYRKEHKEQSKEYGKQYRKEHKEEISQHKKIYMYVYNRKDTVREKANKNQRIKRKQDPTFRLRVDISSAILKALKKLGSSKNNQPCWQYLDYTPEQLKQHLESLFEPWMTWENHGKYDPKLRTWQIDHIKPHSLFKYSSMDCEEFRQCWALSNLRPLCAKQNMDEGRNRTRHM